MASNPERRQQLLDGAVEVLAAKGGRGLTFAAVDTAAGVPPGTASNYFASRDQLLAELASHVFTRLTPDPVESARRMQQPSQSTELDLMNWLVERAVGDRAAHLALFELRLEATRNARVAPTVTETFARNLEAITADHVDGGFPGGRPTALVLYLAMSGLLLEHLTMPELLGDDAIRSVVERIVTTVVPNAP